MPFGHLLSCNTVMALRYVAKKSGGNRNFSMSALLDKFPKDSSIKSMTKWNFCDNCAFPDEGYSGSRQEWHGLMLCLL